MNKINSDVVVCLQNGDSGKGKVTYHLLKTRPYDYCVRFNGGPNAGHTLYHKGHKFVTHQIPTGVFFGVKSIIGNSCVVDLERLEGEIKELQDGGIEVLKHLKISKRAHIILDHHKADDKDGAGIGSTKRGIGPCYADKANRTGLRAEHALPSNWLIDLHEEFTGYDKEINILFEGAQGFSLDIDYGDYPFVTSSSCTVAGVLKNGVSWKTIRDVYGTIKAYETYVGTKRFQPDGEIYEKIARAGNEFGATTGRPRQVNWVCLSTIKKAAEINGVNKLIINKMDVLETVGVWAAIENKTLRTFLGEEGLKRALEDKLQGVVSDFYYSGNPYVVEGL